MPEVKTIKLSEVKFDQAIYPRKQHNPALVQRYAASMKEIEARGNWMSVATDGTLLDGRHRHIAYQKNLGDLDDRDVSVFWYDVEEAADKFALAVELNSEHGDQLSDEDKKRCVLKFYSQFDFSVKDAARQARVGYNKALEWTKAIREEKERRENGAVFDMWLAFYTYDEISEISGINKAKIKARIDMVCSKSYHSTKVNKLSNFEIEVNDKGKPKPDSVGWQRPIYNVWTFAKKTNEVGHPGNSEERIVEHLLYLYTDRYDTVLDPFAGGGATIDVCKRRLRRYWASDRKPIVEREQEIRQLDIVTDLPPLGNRWSEVALTYLDPPYWKQAEGEYSQDANDLANMPLAKFTDALVGVVNRIAEKQSHGFIAMLMQPTQWKADDKQFTDHVLDTVNGANKMRLAVENRVSVPYSTEQCNPQMVDWAKDNKMLSVRRPMLDVVLKCWVTDTKDTSWRSKTSTILEKSSSDRLSRSTL